MKVLCCLLIGACLIACGCASVTEPSFNTTIVMAKNVEKGKGASGITDVFTHEGIIFMFATFQWEDVDKPGGQQNIEVKWFNEDRLVMKSGHKFDFTKTPYVVWFRIYSTALGAGRCHVELSANGHPVGSKSFTVVEGGSDTGPATIPPPPGQTL